jgi:energy-coupling factor transporter ATP-binding protein EcfA2
LVRYALRFLWSTKPEKEVRLDQERYLVCLDGRKAKCYSFIKVTAIDEEGSRYRRDDLDEGLYHSRVKSFFAGLYKTGTPFIYLVMALPVDGDFFQYDFFIGTWVETDASRISESLVRLEQQHQVINTAITVANPRCVSRRVEKGELRQLGERLVLGTHKLNEKAESEDLSKFTPISLGSVGSSPAVIPPEFHVPSRQENVPGGVCLGGIISAGVKRYPLYVDLDDVSRHVCILGMTGSGKTTTAKLLAKRLWEKGVPFLVLDTHNEYAAFAREIGAAVVAPGKDEFILNPLDPMNSRDVSEHAALVTDIFSDIYRFTHPQAFLFRGAVLKLLSEPERASGVRHDLGGLVEGIESFPIKSAYDNETKLALLRRLIPLTEGQGGRSLCGKNSVNMVEVLSRPTVVELGHFRDAETRSIFSSFLLKAVYDYRLGQKQSGLQHAVFIEEARALVPARRSEDPPTVSEKLSGELRKFGEAVVYIAQFPSQVSYDAIKNTGVKVCHRMSWVSDTKLMGDAMNLTAEQTRYLASLSVGEAIVNVSRLQNSVLLSVEAEEVLRRPPPEAS